MVRVLGLYIGEYSVQCDSQFEQSTQPGFSHAIPPITLMVTVEILLSIVLSYLSSSEKNQGKVTTVTPDRSDVTPPVTMVHQGAGKDVTSVRCYSSFGRIRVQVMLLQLRT
ncbi:MAG: hypothetical protein GXY18_12325 [Methanomicrobiales archaeon]|nr:hypothetical protein [Methanomicrobiales archaeon]